MPNNSKTVKLENSIFAPAQDAVFYNYEKIECHLKEIIAENYTVGQKLPAMSEEEQLKLLATDGKLVKRPLVVGDGFVLTGFKEAEWNEKML